MTEAFGWEKPEHLLNFELIGDSLDALLKATENKKVLVHTGYAEDQSGTVGSSSALSGQESVPSFVRSEWRFGLPS